MIEQSHSQMFNIVIGTDKYAYMGLEKSSTHLADVSDTQCAKFKYKGKVWCLYEGEYSFLVSTKSYVPEERNAPKKATEFLSKALSLLEERGKDYDQPEGERSMGKTVVAFNAITGNNLKESDGWLILQLLKDVRQNQNRDSYHADSAEDCISYAALKAEALAEGK